MIWWVLGAVAALVLAVIGWALCARAGQLDDAEGRGDHPDDPAYCPPCGGPCFDEGDDDDRRLP